MDRVLNRKHIIPTAICSLSGGIYGLICTGRAPLKLIIITSSFFAIYGVLFGHAIGDYIDDCEPGSLVFEGIIPLIQRYINTS